MINEYKEVITNPEYAYAEYLNERGPGIGKIREQSQSYLWTLITKGILIQKLSGILGPERIVYQPKTLENWPICRKGHQHLEIFEVNATGLALVGRLEKPLHAWETWDTLRSSYSGDDNRRRRLSEILMVPSELVLMASQLERGQIGNMWVGERPLGLILKSLSMGSFQAMHRDIFDGIWKPNTNYC